VVNIVNCGTNAPLLQTTAAINKPADGEKTVIPATAVSPNPFNNSFTVAIHSDKSMEAVVTLVDMYGRQMQSQKVMLNAGKNNTTVNPFTKMPPGAYFVKIKAGERQEVHKLIKQ
jgi:Secretion system C-terminal sorting domain